jgi:hypothetical protein
MTALLATVSVALYAVSFRRREPISALAGMTVMIAAGIPAGVYATLAS